MTNRRAIAMLSVVALGLATGVASYEPQRPTFRTAAEILLVDALVVGRDGTPVEGLDADQFDVFIDGRRVKIVSVDFLRGSRADLPIVKQGHAPAGSDPEHSRIVLLVVDQNSFPASAQAAAREVVARVVDRVNAEDYLGLVAFPGSIEIPPTRDREQVRRAIDRIGGFRVDALVTRFNLSAADAVALKSREPVTTREITGRECATDRLNPTCPQEVMEEGGRIADALEQQAVVSLTGLRAVVDALAPVPGRKTLIAVSAGLPTSTRPGSRLNLSTETDVLARAAAAANVNLYVLYMNVHFLRYFSSEYGRQNHSIFEDIRLFGYGLERFADTGGGAFFQVEVGADTVVDRILHETSAQYVLAVQIDPAWRDGRPHAIRVGVKQRGTTVRHRRVVLILPARG